MFGARFTLLVGLVVSTSGCSGEPDSDEGAIASEGQALSAACAGGTDSFQGIEGDYARPGVTLRDEMRTLSIRGAGATHAAYTRTVARRCTQLGCTVEAGTVGLQPGSLVFEASGDRAERARETYVLLGMKRDGDTVSELCVARDPRQPFVLRRVEDAAR